MEAITPHRGSAAWQKAVTLAGRVYAATRLLPRDEQAGLGQRLRASAVSVAGSIASSLECSRRPDRLLALQAAQKHLSEAHTLIVIASELGLLSNDTGMRSDVVEVQAHLNRLRQQLERANLAAHASACAPQRT